MKKKPDKVMNVKLQASRAAAALLTEDDRQLIAKECVKKLKRARVKPGQCLDEILGTLKGMKLKFGFDMVTSTVAAAHVCLDTEELPVIDDPARHEVTDGHFRRCNFSSKE